MQHLSLSGGVVALLLATAAPVHAQVPSPLPQGDGRDLVAVVCTQCHALTPLVSTRDGPVGWKRHVYNMVLRGAQLTPSEADTVIAYLIAHFGPGAPIAGGKPIALPAGAGKELVETRCVVCHDLERVTSAKRHKRDWETIVTSMYERWGVSAPDEVRTISAYLVAQFGQE